MPRPRFQRLPAATRQRILRTAAQAFAKYGFQQASMNQILQEAEISKGAAYYYFDDKADLFSTTVSFYAGDLLDVVDSSLAQFGEGDFWEQIIALYEVQLETFCDKPWAFAAIKAGGRLTAAELASEPTLREIQARFSRQLSAIVRSGQEAGVIRMDLPEALLMRLIIAADDALDQWLLENWEENELRVLKAIVRRTVHGLARFMAPTEDVGLDENMEK